MNNIRNEIYEVLNEYKMYVNGLDFEIKGRILKKINSENNGRIYKWEISHYCKPGADAASVYIPSRESAQTLDEAYYLLMLYMEPFTNIGVEINPFY